MAIFMKYGSLKGEVTAEGYLDWIECHSFQFGLGRGISVGTAGASQRESTAPSISEIQLTKTMSAVDALLWKEALGGKASQVDIHLTQTDTGGKHIAYQKYTLKDTLIAGYSIAGQSGGLPTTTLSLNFGEITSEYIIIDSNFNTKTTGKVGYDLIKAKLV
jgi:type VI secretion system secreted protein Hcp